MRLFLSTALLCCMPIISFAEDSALDVDKSSDESPIVSPNIERADVKIPSVQPGQIELIGTAGIFQADGFSSDLMYGLRGAYHWNQKLFLEATYAKAKISEEPRQNLGIPDAFNSDSLTFFDIGAGYNILPGRSFFGKHYTVTTDLYAAIDVGKTKLDSNSAWTISPGMGIRMTPYKKLTLHLDFKDHFVTRTLSDQSSKLKNNLELSLGVGTFF